MARGNVGKTRVLLLGAELGAVSGVSTHLNQLLGSRLTDEFDLQHFAVGSEGRSESAAGRLLRLALSPFGLARRIIRTKADIVHINVAFDHKGFPRDAVYLAIARILRRKVVFQVHGGALPQKLYKSWFLREQIVRRVLDAADAVVLLAKYELDAYSSFAPRARIRLIVNGTVVDDQAALPQVAREGPLRLAYVGRLVATKGVADCIAAAHLLKDAGRDFTLTIVGSGPEELSLRTAASTLVAENKVEFLGARFGADKDRIWQESDIFVFPTSHAEGLPYSLLESMSAGTVPITTRVGAATDVVEERLHGLFVPPGDPQALFSAITELDDDRGLLLSMAQQCMLRIRQDYSVDRLSRDFSDLYRSLVSEHREGMCD